MRNGEAGGETESERRQFRTGGWEGQSDGGGRGQRDGRRMCGPIGGEIGCCGYSSHSFSLFSSLVQMNNIVSDIYLLLMNLSLCYNH